MTEAEVYYKYKKKVYGLALTLVANEFDAKDITSSVFEKYIRYIKAKNTFNSEEHMDRWFSRVTRNAAADYFREKTRQNENEMEEDISDLEEIPAGEKTKADFVVSLERRLAHQEVMQLLSPRYREVLMLFYDFGYSIREIAMQLKESEGTVKTLLFRAKKKYKEIVESRGDNNE